MAQPSAERWLTLSIIFTTIAVAHTLLIAIYHMLKDGKEFVDLGADYYHQFNTEKKANSYIKKLTQLGYTVEATKAS